MMRMTSLFFTTSFAILALLSIASQARPLRGVSTVDLSTGVAIIVMYGNGSPDENGEIIISTAPTCTSEKPCQEVMMSSSSSSNNYEKRHDVTPPPSPKSSPPTKETTLSSNGPSVSSPPSPKLNPPIGQLGHPSDNDHEGITSTSTPSYYISMMSSSSISNYEKRPVVSPPPTPKPSPSKKETTLSSKRPPVSSPPPPKSNPPIDELGHASDNDHEEITSTSTPSYYISMMTHKDVATEVSTI